MDETTEAREGGLKTIAYRQAGKPCRFKVIDRKTGVEVADVLDVTVISPVNEPTELVLRCNLSREKEASDALFFELGLNEWAET